MSVLMEPRFQHVWASFCKRSKKTRRALTFSIYANKEQFLYVYNVLLNEKLSCIDVRVLEAISARIGLCVMDLSLLTNLLCKPPTYKLICLIDGAPQMWFGKILPKQILWDKQILWISPTAYMLDPGPLNVLSLYTHKALSREVCYALEAYLQRKSLLDSFYADCLTILGSELDASATLSLATEILAAPYGSVLCLEKERLRIPLCFSQERSSHLQQLFEHAVSARILPRQEFAVHMQALIDMGPLA